jgi:hypothetical protein
MQRKMGGLAGAPVVSETRAFGTTGVVSETRAFGTTGVMSKTCLRT